MFTEAQFGKCRLKVGQNIPKHIRPDGSPQPFCPAQRPTGDACLFHMDAAKRLLLSCSWTPYWSAGLGVNAVEFSVVLQHLSKQTSH